MSSLKANTVVRWASVADSQPNNYEPSNLADLIDGCRRLHEWVTVLLDDLPPMSMPEVLLDPFRFVGRAIALRQNTALHAAVALALADLGHAALPMVRPACDELIWVTYLGGLTREQREPLIIAWESVESGRSVQSQANYIGKVEMGKLGMNRAFVNLTQQRSAVGKAHLRKLGDQLGWPRELDHLPPSTGWIASRVDKHRLYDFLYSATSKGVHFAPSEYFRSGWSDSPTGPVRPAAEPYKRYRLMFVLHWLAELLLETLGSLWEHVSDFGTKIDEQRSAELTEIAKQIGKFRRVPIVMAQEFNLPVPP